MISAPSSWRGRGWLRRVVIGATVALIVVVSPGPVRGATRTWTGLGADNNWTTPLNWAGSAVPGAGDTALFDGTGVKSATINVNINLSGGGGGLVVNAGYTGTITQPPGVTVTVGGVGFSQASGTFAGGTAAMTVNGPLALSGGAFTATSGTMTVTGNLTLGAATFAPNGGVLSLSGGAATISVGGSATFDSVTVVAGAKTIAAGDTVVVNGLLTLAGGTVNTGTLAARGPLNQAATSGAGTGTLVIDGTLDQTFTGAATTAAGALPNLVIAKPSGTLSLVGTLRTGRNWTYTTGTVDAGSSLVVLTAGTLAGAMPFFDLDLRGGTITGTATDTATVDGTLNLVSGAFNTGTLAARGPLNQAATSGAGTGTLVIDGTLDQTFTGAATTAAGALPNLVIAKPSGTLSLVGTLRTGRNWTYTTGTVDAGSSLVVLTAGTLAGAMPFFDLDLRGGTITGTATDTATVDGTLNLVSGAFNTGTLAARGPLNQAATSGAGTGTLVIDGTLDQTFTGAATTAAGALPNLVIAKPSGTLSLVGTLRTGRNWTYTTGTVDAGSSLVVLTAGTLAGAMPFFDLDLRGGTITGTATDTATVDGTLNLVSGAFNTGTLAARGPLNQAATSGAGTGTLVIDGTLDQTFTGAATTAAGALPNLVIAKPSGTLSLVGTLRTGRNWTYTTGTVDAGSSLVVLTAGTLAGAMPFFDLDLRGGTITGTATDTATVDGTLNLVSGAFNTGTLAARGPLNQAATSGAGTGTLVIDGTLDQTFTGAATTAAGALPNLVIAKPSGTLSLVGTLRTGRNWTYTTGTVDAGSSLVVLTAGTLTSDGMSFADLTVVSGTVSLGNALTVDGDLTITGGVLDTVAAISAPIDVGGNLFVGGTLRGRASTIQVAGDLTINGTFTAATSEMILDGTGGQVIGGTATITFFDLTIDDVAGVALASPIVVGGTPTLTSGTFDISGQSLTIVQPIGGVPDNLAADLAATIVVNGTASGIVVPGSVPVLGALTINNPSGAALTADLTVEGILNLAGGNLDAGSSTVTIGAAGSVVRGTGWVIGQLQKPVSAGPAVVVSFEIGDASAYTPVDVAFDTVVLAGLLMGSTTPGDHPALAGSAIFPPLSVNRYWTLTNTGTAFGTFDATLTWVPSDVDAGATTAAFIVGKLDGLTWTAPAVAAPTPTTITATGMTAFSDLAVGDPPTVDLSITKVAGPDPAEAGLPLVYTLTISNGGPADAGSTSLADVLPAALTAATYCLGSGCDPTAGAPWSSPLDLGTLAAGATVIVRIGADVPADTPDGTTLVNTASVSTTTMELDPSDDSLTISTTVAANADLSITKLGPATTTAGAPAGFDYILTVTNTGPADNVGGSTVTDRLPDGLAFRPLGSDPRCSAVGRDVTCADDTGLATGDSIAYTVHVFVAPATAVGSDLANSASVASDGTNDPDGSNDVSATMVTAVTASIPVPPAPDTGSIAGTIDPAASPFPGILIILIAAGSIAGAFAAARRPD